MLTKPVAAFVTAGFTFLLASASHATAVSYSCSVNDAACAAGFLATGNNAAVGSAADKVDWGLFATSLGTSLNNGSIATNDSMTTPGSDVVKVTSGDGNGFVTYTEGQGSAPVQNGRHITPGNAWNGVFTAATTVLYSSDGTITLSFASPLIGLGIDAQIFQAGAYSETLTAYSSLCTNIATAVTACATVGTGYLGAVSENGNSTGADQGDTSHEGTAPFVGISTDVQNNPNSLATDGISFVTISTICTTPACATAGFAIDTSVLYHYPIAPNDPTPTVPEPGTLGLLGAGLVGLGFLRRRKHI